MFYSLGHGVLVPLSRLLYRPTIEGKGNVPLDGGVILASNHLSFIDSFAIPLVSPRKVRFLAKEVLDRRRCQGTPAEGFFTAVGMVPVNRHSPTAAQESLDKGLEVLKAGDAFGIYRRGRVRGTGASTAVAPVSRGSPSTPRSPSSRSASSAPRTSSRSGPASRGWPR